MDAGLLSDVIFINIYQTNSKIIKLKVVVLISSALRILFSSCLFSTPLCPLLNLRFEFFLSQEVVGFTMFLEDLL